MTFDLIPDNRGIIAILDAQVSGPYRFVHHALVPYVRIGPAHETDPITIRAGAALELLLHEGHAKGLQGLGCTLDFAVMLDGPTGIRLREVAWRATALDQFDPMRQVDSKPMEQMTRARPPRRLPKAPQAALHQSPEPTPAVTPDMSIPEHWRDVCTREDVHPELGDYLVIPSTSDSASELMPTWVVKSDRVDHVHVVKPRLEKPSTPRG